MNALAYQDFLDRKTHVVALHGFKPSFMPDMLFDFQKALVDWSVNLGRCAIFADCGLGKTLMQLTWAENVVRQTGKPVLILTPLGVSAQTVAEAAKIGVDAVRRKDGIGRGDSVVVTNYERLHHFNSSDFAGVVCDESSILKNFAGATREQVTEFMRKTPYRLLCTATAAPNDYIELGTSCEAIGEMERKHMLARFFTHDAGDTGTWRLKGHARSHLFWRWVCSWARALRKPSDLGFSDFGFHLPELHVCEHTVSARQKADGVLFDLPAADLNEQREELRRTKDERCEMAAQLICAHKRPAIAWCHLNDEGDLLERLIPDAVQISGSDSDERKEELLAAFADGSARVLVTKPKIAGFGLNWQHCAHMTFFPSHSYEQYYQSVRRCWRFGQKNEVTVDLISTDGQAGVLANLRRKVAASDAMFAQLVLLMRDELRINRTSVSKIQEAIPSWL